MKLRTEIKLEKAPFQLDFDSKMIFCGSCFAENIGTMMQERKFKVAVNPLGISYNPISLNKNLKSIVAKDRIDRDLIFKNQDFFYHFDFHGSNNQLDQKTYIEKLSAKIDGANNFFAQANVLFVSLGTANVFKHQSHGIVNNCHKIPNEQFERKTLSVSELRQTLVELISLFSDRQPNFKIIFTVSPIRHIRDGLINDRKSKSILIAAVHDVVDDLNTFYFPSYEMLVDDLRDYRFYEKDLIHPNEMGRTYIWEKFKEVYFSSTCLEETSKVERILSSINHRPFQTNGEAYQAHLKRIQNQIEELPHLDFSAELTRSGIVY